MKVSHLRWTAALIVTIVLLLTLPNLDKVSAAVLPGGAGISDASIEVNVKNTESQPISSAKVLVTSPNLPFPLRIQLDGNGHGKLENLSVASYNIYISAPGYFDDTYIGGQVIGNYSHDVTLEHRGGYTAFESFSFNDNLEYSSLTEIQGTVKWNTYGTIPANSQINIKFLDSFNSVVGNVYSDISTTRNQFTLPTAITIPATASRIGVQLESESVVIAEETRPLWKASLYSSGLFSFKDTNPSGGIIDGVLNWTGSMNESQVSGYRIFYYTKTDSYTEHLLGVVAKRADHTYEISLPQLPNDAAIIGLSIANSLGEEAGNRPAAFISDNRLSDTVMEVPQVSNLPVPSNFQGELSYQAGKLKGWLRWDVSTDPNVLIQLGGQTIYFADKNGAKIQRISTAFQPGIQPYNSYNSIYYWEPITIPNGATQILIYSVLDNGKENDIPAYYPLPPTIQFTDWDERYRSIRGQITWNQDNDESNIKAYYAYFTGYNVTPVEIGHVPKGAPWRISIPTSITIPQGTNFISIYTMDYNNHLTPFGSQVYIYDNSSSYQVQYALKQKYFTGITAIDIKQILLTLSNPSNPFSQISKEDTQVLLSLIKPIMSAN
ncbi:carboxypeptidase regulatory-like domain-containing protein [Paenibacillus frigoriresistens]|uniref:carboxypeptidase-like regulatory domain-containing protein n=1 Tax=Paenibacillus alginolyticus TaxID=59839 RepID=UPI0015636E85|nr:carboxypeptidase-like regulatory domain-containing protein [Paenibacillus frigoriresistens]NRF90881.1 carboxypeptidase regulatory-like domain-containing protein [Paenibacillus frigoriresistens]